jgi:hypothetical protein
LNYIKDPGHPGPQPGSEAFLPLNMKAWQTGRPGAGSYDRLRPPGLKSLKYKNGPVSAEFSAQPSRAAAGGLAVTFST